MAIQHAGFMVLRSVLALAAGGGAVLGGSYLASRLKSRQEMESRLDRIEALLEEVAKESEKPAAKRTAAKTAAKGTKARPSRPTKTN